MLSQIKVEPANKKLLTGSTIQKVSSSFFSLSFDPLIKWMCVIGFPLPPVAGSSFHLSHFIRSLYLFLGVLIQLWSVIHVYVYADNVIMAYYSGSLQTTASSWNYLIDCSTFMVYNIGGHVFMLYVTRPKTWARLNQCFVALEKNVEEADIYLICRRTAIYSVIYSVVSVCFSKYIFHQKIS